MEIQVDQRLLSALEQWVSTNKTSPYELAKRTGIAESTFSFWKSGRIKSIRQQTWEKLEPFLGPFYDASAPSLPVRPDPYGDAIRANASKMMKDAAQLQQHEEMPPAHVRRWPPVGAPAPWGAEILDELTEDVALGAEQGSAGLGATVNGVDARVWVREMPQMELGHIIVSGNSMAPTMRNGDRLACYQYHGQVHLGPGKNVTMSVISRLINDGQIIVYSLDNGDSIAIKRARLVKTGRGNMNWVLWLEADNAAWSEENEFPRCITREDDLILYGTVIGRVVEGEELPKVAHVPPRPFLS